jgi:hypothetical protein
MAFWIFWVWEIVMKYSLSLKSFLSRTECRLPQISNQSMDNIQSTDTCCSLSGQQAEWWECNIEVADGSCDLWVFSESKLLYDWRSVSMSWCRAHSVRWLLSESCGLVFVGRPLWRDVGSAVCNAITQWSKSRRTRNHTLLFHLRLACPGGPCSCIYIPKYRVAQLYSWALGSLYVASYHWQSYGGGILTNLENQVPVCVCVPVSVSVSVRPPKMIFFNHPSLFTICTNTFSKSVKGSWWVSWRREIISTLL